MPPRPDCPVRTTEAPASDQGIGLARQVSSICAGMLRAMGEPDLPAGYSSRAWRRNGATSEHPPHEGVHSRGAGRACGVCRCPGSSHRCSCPGRMHGWRTRPANRRPRASRSMARTPRARPVRHRRAGAHAGGRRSLSAMGLSCTGGIRGTHAHHRAVFSTRPSEEGAAYNEVEDLIHSLAATAMGFSFALGVVAVSLMRVASTTPRRALDATAVLASIAIPLGMLQWPEQAGLLQRVMFAVAYVWFGTEAARRGADHPEMPAGAGPTPVGGAR